MVTDLSVNIIHGKYVEVVKDPSLLYKQYLTCACIKVPNVSLAIGWVMPNVGDWLFNGELPRFFLYILFEKYYIIFTKIVYRTDFWAIPKNTVQHIPVVFYPFNRFRRVLPCSNYCPDYLLNSLDFSGSSHPFHLFYTKPPDER